MNHFTSPLIPVITEANKQHFMHNLGKPFIQDADVEGVPVITAPLSFDKSMDLLSLSRDQGLINVGHQSDTDSVDPDSVSVTAVYLAHPTKGVLKATLIERPTKLEAFAPAKDNPHARLLRQKGRLRFALQFDNGESLEFELWLAGHLHADTGTLLMTNDGKLEIMRQSPWCVREQPLFGFRPHGFDLKAKRINYNRRAAPAPV